MYQSIVVPVDLSHRDSLQDALDVAARLAKHNGAKVTYVGVTGTTPSRVAHNLEEYRSALDALAEEEGRKHGHPAEAAIVASHDLRADLDRDLLDYIRKSDCDLVVMASHVPGFLEFFFSSNGGYIASHAPCSVFLVRS
ncbi:universal stress protein [Paracoccaceae bacterium GXU_MW_L88]